MAKLTIRVPDDLHQQLSILQQEDKLRRIKAGLPSGESINDIVVRLLREHVEQAQKSVKN